MHEVCVAKDFITLHETNIAPENGWLEDYFFETFLLGPGLVSGAMLGSGLFH